MDSVPSLWDGIYDNQRLTLSYLLSKRKGHVNATPSNAGLTSTYNAAERSHAVTVFMGNNVESLSGTRNRTTPAAL